MAAQLQLVGNVAVVTAGSKGTGFAVADYLMSHGADVVLSARTHADVEAADDGDWPQHRLGGFKRHNPRHRALCRGQGRNPEVHRSGGFGSLTLRYPRQLGLSGCGAAEIR